MLYYPQREILNATKNVLLRRKQRAISNRGKESDVTMLLQSTEDRQPPKTGGEKVHMLSKNLRGKMVQMTQ